jgi:glycosyltransferase 2 family protein
MWCGCGERDALSAGHNWLVTLPNGPLTLLQIFIGIIDLTCCAAAM